MLKPFFQAAALVAALATVGGDAASEATVVDYASACGFATPDSSIIDFAFADGSTRLADGDIATASLSLSKAYYDDPPASVSISAPGVKCGRSTFAFDKSDPSTFDQSVTCRTDGAVVAPGKDGALLDIAMIFNYELMSMDDAFQQVIQKVCAKLLLQRQLSNSGHGGGVGDPHLTTFDRVNYDFQKPGVFRLFQSRNLLVQIFQEKCTPVASRGDAAPSCYQGLAVAFAGSVAKFFIQDGKIQLGKGTSSLDWLSVERLKGKTDGYRIFVAADQATYVDVSLSTWINSYPYLNIAVQASPYFKDSSVNGLLGNWNGNPSDDVRDNNKLAAAHSFSLTDNLFTCVGDGCATFLQPASLKDDMARALPNNMTMLHQSYAVVGPSTIPLRAFSPALVPYVKTRSLRGAADGSTAGVVHAAADSSSNETITFPPSAAKPSEAAEAPPANVTVRATQLCNQVIAQIPTCDKYVGNRAFYIETVCLGDAVLLGDLSVVDGTKINYLRECRRELDSRIEGNTSTVAEMQALVADRTSLHFGDLTACAKNCSGHGTCLAAGCKCNPGFTGVGCDITV